MESIYLPCGEGLTAGTLEQAFPFAVKPGHVAALVGGGGKTTLMYALAELACRRGLRTAVTTSTHIAIPDSGVLCHSLEDCRALWQAGRYAVWARPVREPGKLGPLEPEEFQTLYGTADLLLVEADGAKHHPCKVPASYEPVIPAQADVVIGVIGITACGRPLSDACFRWDLAAELLRCGPEHQLTPADLATILLSERGTRRDVCERSFCAVINQCDNAHLLRLGREVLDLLPTDGSVRRVLTALAPADSLT